jgi:hypothetical protein
MKLYSHQKKINFSIILFLSSLFAIIGYGSSALANKTSQSDKFVAFINYWFISSRTTPINTTWSGNVNVSIGINTSVSGGVSGTRPSTTETESSYNDSAEFSSSDEAYDWLKTELTKAGENTAAIKDTISGGIKKINFDYFLEKPIVASKNINYKLFTKSVNVAQMNGDKSVKEIEIIDKNLGTFIEDFDNFVSVFNSFSSPDKQATISDLNIFITSANKLRKSTYIVGEDMKIISVNNPSQEQLLAVKNMLESLETVTVILETVIPQLNQISLAISTSE